jgi:hypothetical protein
VTVGVKVDGAALGTSVSVALRCAGAQAAKRDKIKIQKHRYGISFLVIGTSSGKTIRARSLCHYTFSWSAGLLLNIVLQFCERE